MEGQELMKSTINKLQKEIEKEPISPEKIFALIEVIKVLDNSRKL